MPRVVERSEQTPIPIQKSDLPAGDAVYFCRCGLSKNAPFCDGSHKKTLHEQSGKLYRYEERAGNLEPVLIRIESAPSSEGVTAQ